MATVTLKNVPDGLVRALKSEAKQNRRSLNQEALARLESSLGASRHNGGETVKALRRLHKRLAALPPLTDVFLNRAMPSRAESSRWRT
jgi:plasmid stability protein